MQGRRRKVGVVLTVQQLGQYDEDDLTEALYSIPSSNPNNCIQLMANVQIPDVNKNSPISPIS